MSLSGVNTIAIKPSILRCYGIIFLPFILLIPALLILYITNQSHQSYIDRLNYNSGLKIKAVINSICGIIGLYFWILYMVPISIKSLKSKNGIIFIKDDILYCFENNICRVGSITSIEIEKSFLKIILIVKTNNQSVECGNIVMCKNISNIKSILNDILRLQ
jgi:hypothetical protein